MIQYALLGIAASIIGTQDDALAKYVYPLAKPIASPAIKIDVSDFPESRAWAEKAKEVVAAWFPTVTSLLATEDWKAPKEINIVIKKEISAPAWASGNTITVSGKWITQHPDDLGMMVHEMTHLIQAYPRNKVNTGWLVEGIADYIRWWRYEPEAPRTRIDPVKNKYTDAYRVTAYWLAWVSRKYDKRLVPALDRELRKGNDPMPVFEKFTTKSAEELWKEFVASKP
ncbi:MAG: hypothetical protein H7Y17_17015 [Chlorobia bacterium]|nr:hypothetical protein [Fimbriimonadaceae bacterium]